MIFIKQIEDFIGKLSLPRRFTFISLGYLAGTTLASAHPATGQNNFALFIFLSTLILLFGFINLRLKNHLFALSAIVLLFFIIGFFWTKHFQNLNNFQWAYGEKATLTGQIINRPVLKETKQEIILAVSEIVTKDKTIRPKHKPKILVYLPRYPYLDYSDIISLQGTIEKPGYFNDFNFENYLKKYPIFAYIKQTDSDTIIGQSNGFGQRLLSSLYNFCSRVEEILLKTLPEPQSSFAAGLILGKKTNLPEELLNNLQITGTTHLIALSGYNVTIIITALTTLLSAIMSRRKLLMTGLILIIFFILMTGMSPSVVRAAIFSVLILFGKTIGRKGDQTNILLLTALLMVFFNPNLVLYDISFQLSFAAFLGLLFLAPPIEFILNKSKIIGWADYLKKTLAETLGAQMAVLPVIIYSFKTVSLISPLANLAVLGVIPIAMILTFIGAFLGLIWLPLGKLCSVFIWPLLSYVLAMINLFAKIPSASLQLENNTMVLLLIIPSLLIISFYLISNRKKYEKIR